MDAGLGARGTASGAGGASGIGSPRAGVCPGAHRVPRRRPAPARSCEGSRPGPWIPAAPAGTPRSSSRSDRRPELQRGATLGSALRGLDPARPPTCGRQTPGAMAGKPWCRRTSIQMTGATSRTRAEHDAGVVFETVEQLEGGRQQHERQGPADQPPRRPRGQMGAHPDARNAAHQQRRRQIQLEVAEQDVPQRGGRHQRHRLDQVGAHQLAGLERRVQHHERDDDERAGPDRGHADDDATEQRRARTVGSGLGVTDGRSCGSGSARPSRRRARSSRRR